MNKKALCIIGILLGITLIIFGVALDGRMNTGIFLGLGCGLLGGVGAYYLELRMVEKNPSLQKTKEIEMKDERNQLIRAKAGAAASRVIFFLLCGSALVLNFFYIDKIVYIGIATLIVIQTATLIGAYNYCDKRI